MTLDDGTKLHFGYPSSVIEKLSNLKAVESPSPVARKGIDTQIEWGPVTLEFDIGLLKRITMRSTYRFVNPPDPYPESWKNFEIIGAQKIFEGMHRDDFMSYLNDWQNRAKQMGAERINFGDLGPLQYCVREDRDNYLHSVHVAMGPSRRAHPGGGIWTDGWHASFALPWEKALKEGTLSSLSAFRDEFNTVARRKS